MRIAAAVCLMMILAACSTGGTDSIASTTPEATTTTIAAAPVVADADDLCTALKVAFFDLGAGYDSLLGGTEQLQGLEDLSEEEAGELFARPIVDFYSGLGELAETAPADIAGDLATLSEAGDALEEALVAQSEELDGIDDPDVADAAERVEAWTRLNCDTEVTVAPETVVTETLFAAMFGALGEGLAELGEELGEGFEEPFEDLATGDDGTFSAVTYGDDPELDALWDACGGSDMAACDELYWQTFGVYELYAETCGGVLPFRPGTTGTCVEKLGEDGGDLFETDPYLTGLASSCEEGDLFSCDALYGSVPVGSELELVADTCGGTRPAETGLSCEWSGDPFAYGDDAELDGLWDACDAGDESACSDLYFDSTFDSKYETFGDTCGSLLERGDDCSLVLDLLDEAMA